MQKAAVMLTAAAFTLTAAATAPAVARVSAVTPIRHIVVIYLENHTFDDVLGYWCRGHPRRCPDGGMPAKVTLSNGTVVTPGVLPDTVPKVLHSVASQLAAMNIQGGVPRMNGLAEHS